MKKRFIVIVLDSFGVGYMDDVPTVRPEDIGANTCKHILEKVTDLKLINLEKLGIMNALGEDIGLMKKSEYCTYGKSKLMHFGGDTFFGHQEIMGTLPRMPLMKPFSFYLDKVYDALVKNGYTVEKIGDNHLKYLFVNGCVAVGDNLETDLGQVYNITSTLQKMPFDDILKIGKIVRANVEVARVIVFAGENSTVESIKAAAEEKSGLYMGINAPKSKVYEKGYMVRHLGYGIDPETQVPTIMGKAGKNSILIGKVADIVENELGKSYMGLVDTKTIFNITLEEMDKIDEGFICVNIQETDLSGHAEDAEKYAEILEISDDYIGEIMNKITDDDILIVTADHGNDPTIGHSRHTRENVPLLIYKKDLKNTFIGLRESLSDIGATAAEYFQIKMPQNGESFLDKL